MVRIAHLSDTHLDGGPDRARRVERLVEEISTLGDIDLVLVSGDLTDDADPAEYAQFFDLFSGVPQLQVVPGNHDRRSPLAAHVEPDTNGFFNSVRTVGGLTVIGLDSLIESSIGGELAAESIAFAHEALSATGGPAILALHHPPVPVGHEFMDRNGLLDPVSLADVVHDHAHVAAVLVGHVHTAFAAGFAGRPILGAPGVVSTMRLGGRMDPIADPSAMPGMAIHTVVPDGSISTVHHYLSPERP